ncbi:methyl-accepting chemotaxis protein [Treponema sp. HNW]|uniref:methyl-accepting chemotaxis protein n=1 Tax=Treponema sp. HNW TaxID=3116654 RepID=UPI003D14CEAF
MDERVNDTGPQKKRKSLNLKIGAVFCVSMLMFLAVLLPITVLTIRKTAQKAVDTNVTRQLEGDISVIENYLEILYGTLTVKDGELRGMGAPVQIQHIDRLASMFDIEITVFDFDGQNFKRILTTIKNADGKRASGTLLDKGEAYNRILSGNHYVGSAQILDRDFITAYVPIQRSGKISYVLFAGIEMTEINAGIESGIQRSVISVVTVSLVLLIVVVIISVIIVTGLIVRPIGNMVPVLHDVGEGDLTVKLPVRGNDEITDFSVYFNQSITKMQSTLKSVLDSSDEMRQVGETLAGSMTETASAVHEISSNIEGIKEQTDTQAASVGETAFTVKNIIDAINKLNENIENQAASVAESSAAIEQMVSNIASITQTLSKTDGVIKTLADATADGKETIATAGGVTQRIAEESGSLLEASGVIQHIASQTNLLAMNAAIEAAHAGESGKGFAVVADEIRKLAEESSSQGKTITETLKILSGEIETLSASARVAEEKFNIIFNLSEQVKHMSTSLTDSMREQEGAGKEVLTAIRDINAITNEVSDGSAQMLHGGQAAAKQMEKLDDLTRIITDSMNEMAAGVAQINHAIQDVNEVTQKNKQSIESLAVEVKKFKV